MNAPRRLPARLLGGLLVAVLAVLAGSAGLFGAPRAFAEDGITMPLDKGCVYVAEDWNGYEFTFYCPKGSKDEQGAFFNVHNNYYVNWSKDSPNQTWDKGGPYTGQPCTHDLDSYKGKIKDTTRTNCLDTHDWTGVGEWMRGQSGNGILDRPELHQLKDIHDDPCSALEFEAAKAKPFCPDIRKVNPCEKIADKEQRGKCNTEHPWFNWQPPVVQADDIAKGCRYVGGPVKAECAGTQLVGNDQVSAPRGVIEPLSKGMGLIIALVFVSAMFGLLLHLYFGLQAYRNGDTAAQVFGQMSWTLMACIGASGASGLVWMVFSK